MTIWPFRRKQAARASGSPALFAPEYGGWTDIFARASFEPSQRPAWENVTILACIKWASRVFPEADCYVERKAPDGTRVALWDHPMATLIARPNGSYSGRLLWSATIASLMVSDQAFWLKVRSGSGKPVELWYLPEHRVKAVRRTAYVDYYEYDTGVTALQFPVSDIVHFRDGLDPMATYRGLAKLPALGDDILTDNEASAFMYRVLRNMGVVPYAVSPEGADVMVGPVQAEELKRRLSDHSGRNRGKFLVPNFPLKFTKLALTPEEMALDKVRRWPQDKVCSVVGINPMVLGLPSESRTFSNFAEAREAAMEEYVLPTQRLLCDEINNQLLPDFTNDRSFGLRFDLSQIRVLQEDRNAAEARVRENWKAGLIDRAEARAELGKPERPEDVGVYYAAPGPVGAEQDAQKAFRSVLAEKWRLRASLNGHHDDLAIS